jgi:hypothetical protein
MRQAQSAARSSDDGHLSAQIDHTPAPSLRFSETKKNQCYGENPKRLGGPLSGLGGARATDIRYRVN